MCNVKRYLTLLNELSINQLINDGLLTKDSEIELISELDNLWFSLSVEEQEEVENELINGPGTSYNQDIIDLDVKLGQSISPRKVI